MTAPVEMNGQNKPPLRVVRCVAVLVGLVAATCVLTSCDLTTGISGKVTIGGVARAGIEVAVFPKGDKTTPAQVVSTDTTGKYATTLLAPGTYWVRLGQSSWFNAQPLTGTPTDVVVAQGSFATVSADTAALTGGLSGTVTDQGTGQAISGVTVTALARSYLTNNPVATATTNASGFYSFAPTLLPVGSYVV